MYKFALVTLAWFAFANPAMAESELHVGFEGALRGCETWILKPASWNQGPEAFLREVGLGPATGFVDKVDPAALPPKQLRVANHYLRINSTSEAGFILVVSDQLPMCHITGGGQRDLQPSVESVLNSEAFKARWMVVEDKPTKQGLSSTVYRNRANNRLSIFVSRAKKPDQRRDRVQLIATATYDLGN